MQCSQLSTTFRQETKCTIINACTGNKKVKRPVCESRRPRVSKIDRGSDGQPGPTAHGGNDEEGGGGGMKMMMIENEQQMAWNYVDFEYFNICL